MSFLDKFKGKTTQLSTAQISGVLGQSRSPHKTNITHRPLPNSPKSSTHSPNKNNNQHRSSPGEAPAKPVNPFSVSNPFYLDELEREKDQRSKKEKEIRERKERELKKREQLDAKLMESGLKRQERFKDREWKMMGGLGANVGTEEWNYKKSMQEKMKNFSTQIKKMNFTKIKCVPFMGSSFISDGHDSRTKALEYSRSIPRPTLVAGSRVIEVSPRGPTENQRQMQYLSQMHDKYSSMVQRL